MMIQISACAALNKQQPADSVTHIVAENMGGA
jgi:hypothetical protein